MLLELAIGDAYGAGFEYASRDFVEKENHLEKYVKHPRHQIVPGCYTDDTQMALAIVELLVEETPWTRENIANKFVEVFKRDPREGYAMGFYHFLQNVNTGKEFLEKILPQSDKSGAAMRASAIGILPSTTAVIEKTTIQAKITHDTPDGIHAAVVAALIPHYFLYHEKDPKNLTSFLCDHVPGQWDSPWKGKVKSKGWMSVRAAITAIKRNNKLSLLLKDCIQFTGDVDTVATIALAGASCSSYFEKDLPQNLVDTLEAGPFGKSYLEELDRKLQEKLHSFSKN